MATCFPTCERKKFSKKDIERFSSRIKHVLENTDARKIFKEYLHEVKRRDMLKVLKLWEDANIFLKLNEPFDEEILMEQIYEIDDFNTNPFLTLGENGQKLMYVNQECARILNKMLDIFIKYLEQFHKQ